MISNNLFYQWLETFLKLIAETFAMLQPFVTVIAILAGLCWFLRRREKERRVNISHTVVFQDLGPEVYVGITLEIENIGHVILDSSPSRDSLPTVMIEELSPYLKTEQVSQLQSPEYKMKPLGRRTLGARLKVEPGELQALLFEFIIQKDTEAIKVYSFIKNGYNKQGGWTRTTIHKVTINE